MNSFNRNKPFDRFTLEQLAGDLLPDPTPETLTATCFNRLTMMTREGGAQDKEYLAKYAADRVRTVGLAFLGSTFACAECHDHKYDPIRQKDFYSLAAYFADVQQWGVYADYGYTSPGVRGLHNDSPFPPEIEVESRYLKGRIAQLRKQIDQIVDESAEALEREPAQKAAFESWRRDALAFLAKHPDRWETPEPEVKPVAKPGKQGEAPPPAPGVTVEKDRAILLTDRTPGSLEITLRPDSPTLSALRLELLPRPENDGTIFRKGASGGFISLNATLHRADGQAQKISFRYAEANHSAPRYNNGSVLTGVHRGWQLSGGEGKQPHIALWHPERPVRLGKGDRLTLSLPDIAAGCLRVSVSAVSAGSAADQEAEWPHQYLLSTAWDEAAFKKIAALEAEIHECRGGKTPVLVTKSVSPLVTRLLPRGNWQDESGPVCAPAPPHFLPGYRPGVAEGKGRQNRLDLARWLVSPENPLTARVFVNRLWKQFFGVGLSASVEDLGAQGEWPTHPELLDWLAVEFRESGWNVKHLVRLIVTSSTYRQSSLSRPDLQKKDPANRLLARQNARRLEAEFVRDNALAVAGLLHRDIGGPPVKPYQPAGYYANLQFPDRPYQAHQDQRQYRRGLYTHWQRTFLHPMLLNFDAPSREDATCTRTEANTPQQALTLLNDPTFVEAARVFAASLLTEKTASDSARLNRAFQRTLSRLPTPEEKKSLLAFVARMRTEYKARPDDVKKLLTVGNAPVPAGLAPLELAAWTNACRVLLNLHETITRY